MTAPVTLVDSFLVFVVSLVVGSVSVLVGARLMVDEETGWPRAVAVALVGAAPRGVASYLVGWVPVLGPLAILLAWVGAIDPGYPGGWASAAIGVVAWIVAAAVLYALGTANVIGPDVLGLPGV